MGWGSVQDNNMSYVLLKSLLAWLVMAAGFRASLHAADEFIRLTDVQAAFERVSADGTLHTFSCGEPGVPPGGHIQGIQLKHDAAGKRWLAFLSHDSQSQGYVLVASFPPQWQGSGELLHVHKFAPGRLRHAGGMQLLGDVLAVGLEDNRSKDRSEIQFWNVAEPTAWRQLSHLKIARSGLPKDKTSGAVGIIRMSDDVLVAVGNWDCRAIDFYRSSTVILSDKDCRFAAAGRWLVDSADRSNWQPDQEFGSYQSINFVEQSDGSLYLLGFHQDSRGRDFADLYAVDLDVEANRWLRKIATRELQLAAANHFKYGGGLLLVDDGMWFLSTERSLSDNVRINIAR
jgi:hypothetical protein